MQGFISSVGNIESGGQGGEGESFVKLIVDLTGVTPTTETVNNKEYNKFTFNKTSLTFKTLTPFGDEETVAVDDALIYKLLPISNNNEDIGVNISYDGNTFVGYVLAQDSTLTTVTFMFAYYIILSQTSVIWKNFEDLILSSGGGSLYLNQIQATVSWNSGASSGTLSFSFYSSSEINSLNDLRTFLSSCPTAIGSGSKGIFLNATFRNSSLSTTLFIHRIELSNSNGDILFYTYNGAIGKSPDWINIFIFIIKNIT